MEPVLFIILEVVHHFLSGSVWKTVFPYLHERSNKCRQIFGPILICSLQKYRTVVKFARSGQQKSPQNTADQNHYSSHIIQNIPEWSNMSGNSRTGSQKWNSHEGFSVMVGGCWPAVKYGIMNSAVSQNILNILYNSPKTGPFWLPGTWRRNFTVIIRGAEIQSLSTLVQLGFLFYQFLTWDPTVLDKDFFLLLPLRMGFVQRWLYQ